MKKYNFRYYFKNYRFSSLFLKNFLTILLVLYLPLSLTCLGISLYFQSAWFDEVTSAAEGAVANVQEIVDTVQTNVMAAAINTASDTSVNRFVLTDEWDFPSYEVAQNIKGVMRDLVVSSGEYIDSIYVYSDRNGYLLSNSISSSSATFFDMEWLPYCLEQSQSLSQWTWGRSGVSQLGVRQPYISTAGSVPYSISGTTEGFVVINLSGRWIAELVTQRGTAPLRDFFILDRGGRLLFSLDSGRLGGTLEEAGYPAGGPGDARLFTAEDGQKLWISCSPPSENGWLYVAVNSLEEYDRSVSSMQGVVWVLLFALFLVSIGVAYVVSLKVFLPIQNVIEMMDDPKSFYDQNTGKKGGAGYNELRYITASFLQTITKTERAEQELIQYVTRLKETQTALLQAQINPHFLYNTLQTINFMAISLTKSDNQVSKAIGMLSSMFSQMMQVDSNTIPIRDELDYCRSYLDLELLRHGGEFSVEWDVDESLLDCFTVKLTLQPILENAIKYGLDNPDEPGKIRIRLFAREDAVVFTVEDNGRGADDARIAQMNESLGDVSPFIGTHIGVRNVHERIGLVFGSGYGLTFRRSEQGGVAAFISIPKTMEAGKPAP